ncbi:unnamed protein product [marine sediment metagenome]|uniref:Uncharacterized protein n=1 Tax=marine sediment metagenome TaxID=412755 RepID=X1B737_9ZZZZ
MTQKHKCQSCGGVGIESPLSEFRGKLLCGVCIGRWIGLDRRLQRENSFGEMIYDKPRQGRKKNTERDAEIRRLSKEKSVTELAGQFNLSLRRIQGIIGSTPIGTE